MSLLLAAWLPACAEAGSFPLGLDLGPDTLAFVAWLDGATTKSVDAIGEDRVIRTIEGGELGVVFSIEARELAASMPYFDASGMGARIERRPPPNDAPGVILDSTHVQLRIPTALPAKEISREGSREGSLETLWLELGRYSLVVPARFDRCAGDPTFALRPFLASALVADEGFTGASEAVLVLGADRAALGVGSTVLLAERGKPPISVTAPAPVLDLAVRETQNGEQILIAVGGRDDRPPGFVDEVALGRDRLETLSSTRTDTNGLLSAVAQDDHVDFLASNGVATRTSEGGPLRRAAGPPGSDTGFASLLAKSIAPGTEILLGAGFAFRGNVASGGWLDVAREAGFPQSPRLRGYTFLNDPPAEWLGGYSFAKKLGDGRWIEPTIVIPPNASDECTRRMPNGFRELTASMTGLGRLHTGRHVVVRANDCPTLFVMRASDDCVVALNGAEPSEYLDVDDGPITLVVGRRTLEEVVGVE
ncbi:MAG: hypothetical protein HYV07_06725 [Deltaproteobacteria bacterium]|nr:hypothetical protein [Deltaproteobacteria bacterium]